MEGEQYRWEMEVDDDWLDMNIISKVNSLLDRLSSEKRFFAAVIDQTCLVGFFNEWQVSELSKLLDIKFEIF